MSTEFPLEDELEFEGESDFEKRLREKTEKKKSTPKKPAPKKPRKPRAKKNKIEPDPEPLASEPAPKPQTSSIDPEPMAGADTAPPLTPNALDTTNQKEIDKANRQRARERREQIAEQKRLLRDQIQNEAAMRRQQYREQKVLSKEAVTGARSEAISQRIKSYALGSALGFPGYVAASIADSLVFRPRETEATGAQTRYQADLQRYNEQLAADARTRQRQQEADIRNTPIEATALDPNTGKPLPPGPRTQTGGLPPGGPGSPVNPPPPLGPPGQPPPLGPGSGGQPPVTPPGGQPPIPPGGGLPPPIPPTPPGAPAPLPPGLALALGPLNEIIVGSLLALQAVNRTIDSVASSATTTGKAIANGTATAGTKGIIDTSQRLADPLGINVPLNVAVKGFDFLLDINESILQAVKGNEAFAPQTLQADVEGQILMLGKQIEVAQRLDKMSSELVKANTNFELAWQDLRTQLLEVFIPIITGFVKTVEADVKIANSVMNAIRDPIVSLPIPAMMAAEALFDILGIMKKDANDLDNANVMADIKQFFDPTLATGKMRKGTVPNP